MGFRPYIVLLDYLFISIGTFIALITVLSTFWIISKLSPRKISDITPTLWVYLISAALLHLSMCQHAVYMVINWNIDLSYPFHGFFITGLIDHSLLPALPIAIFFLTIDRCTLMTLKRIRYPYLPKFLAVLSVIFMLGMFALNFILPITNNLGFVPKVYCNNVTIIECVAFSCLQKQISRVTYTGSKIAVIITNFFVGCWFLFAVYIFKRDIGGSQNCRTFSGKMGENLITRILIFECIFDFIPHLIDMIFVATTGTTPMTYIGPFSRTIVVFDSLSTSITNFRAFYRMYQQNTSNVNTVISKLKTTKISPILNK